MSLLEDLFLEDEAGEAQELERVLEGDGDEYDERPVSPNSDDNEEKDNEAVEDKRRVDPTQGKVKRVIKNPRFVLNPARLTGPRGIQVLPDHFKDFKFNGKGHEKEDLDMVLKKLEHWAYRLYPKFAFHDCLKKIETLGKKKTVMVHLRKIRLDMLTSEETVVQKDSSDDDEAPTPVEDEFDKLLQQQIELARATPAPDSVKKPTFSTPRVDRSHMMPKATSSPSISDEQRERMLNNRRLAEERRLAKLRNESSVADITSTTKKHSPTQETNLNQVVEIDDVPSRKHNRLKVIDSSDEEDVTLVNESIIVDVDVHKKVQVGNEIEIIDIDKNYTANNKSLSKEINENQVEIIDDIVARKHNQPNIIDSSDEEDLAIVNESITIDVDVHKQAEKVVEIIDSNMNKEEIDVILLDAKVDKPNNDFDDLISSAGGNKDSDGKVLDVDNEQYNVKDQTEIIADDEMERLNRNSSNTTKNYVDQHNNESPRNKAKNDSDQHMKDIDQEINDENKDMQPKDGLINHALKHNEASELISNNEKVASNIAEDIMDVDFSDDF